jgi:hypothetical protein
MAGHKKGTYVKVPFFYCSLAVAFAVDTTTSRFAE